MSGSASFQREEFLILRARLSGGLGPTKLQMGEYADAFVREDVAVVHDFRELSRIGGALTH
jgi:hypothetical protein